MPQFRRIVCPTDFSPTADAALAYAVELARAAKAELVLLHVLPTMIYPLRGLGMAEALPHLQAELHTRGKERLAEAAIRSARRHGSASQSRPGCRMSSGPV